jgi:hypothetical protein
MNLIAPIMLQNPTKETLRAALRDLVVDSLDSNTP